MIWALRYPRAPLFQQRPPLPPLLPLSLSPHHVAMLSLIALLFSVALSLTPSQETFQVRPHVPDSVTIVSQGVSKRKAVECTFSHDSAGGYVGF